MYKYILFIIIGILFFLYVNNLNKFTIGGIAWAVPKSTNSNPNSRDSWDQYNYYFNNDYTEEYINTLFPHAVIINDFPTNVGNIETYMHTPRHTPGDIPRTWIGHNITFNHYPRLSVGGELDLSSQPDVSGIGGLEFIDQPPEDGMSRGGMSIRNVCSSIVNVFRQLDLPRTRDSSTLDEALDEALLEQQEDQEVTILEPTKEVLEEEFGYNMGEPLIVDGEFKLFNVRVTDLNLDGEKMELLQSMFTNKGDTMPNYAINKKDNENLYFLTINENGIDVVISRIKLKFDIHTELLQITSYPSQSGYGTKMFKILSNLRYNEIRKTNPNIYYIRQINTLIPSSDDLVKKFYRKVFRLSVKLETEGGWIKIDSLEKFSIFLPLFDEPFTSGMLYRDYEIMKKLYFDNDMFFDYDSLFYELYPDDLEEYNPENRKKYNHFLMQLDEYTVTGKQPVTGEQSVTVTLPSLNPRNIEEFIETFHQFIRDNYP